ncbi:MAG: S8 family serine peptidase [Lysobacterales bacterium]
MLSRPHQLIAAIALLLVGAGALADSLPPSAQQELALLRAHKAQRAAGAIALDSALWLAVRAAADPQIRAALPRYRFLRPDPSGRVLVDIELHTESARAELDAAIKALPDAELIAALGRSIRARLRLADLSALATRPGLRRIGRAVPALTADADPVAVVRSGPRPVALNTSQGRIAHRVDAVRDQLGYTGLGQKVCVLSDSVDHLGTVQASADLPAAIELLPGQSGRGNGFAGEGTAMLEIVHDLAPDAALGFASAFNGVAQFAQNIRDLRFQKGCDVLVDDVFYFDESPFQDGPIAQAVDAVSADGALYFAAAGNEGNRQNGSAGVFQGDFVDGGAVAALPGATVNMFSVPEQGSSQQLRVIAPGFASSLFWSDALGASGNDYDLFVLSPDLAHVLDSSTDVQNGDDDPLELTGPSQLDDRIVVVANAGAAPRFLHVNAIRGRFNLASDGQIKGHPAALGAMALAAVGVNSAAGGVFVGGASNPVEPFSAEGPRQIFYQADGSPANPGNPSLLSDGGVVRSKPDFAAADGVTTATPGFAQFFGTSAAAPHAAAIAALLRQADPGLDRAALAALWQASALDIESPGADALAGAGIVMADAAMAALPAAPIAHLRVDAQSVLVIDGDAGPELEPGETFELRITLSNDGAAPASDISAELLSTDPGVELLRATSDYPDLAVAGSAAASVPFRLRLAPSLACGRLLNLRLRVSANGLAATTSPLEFALPALRVGAQAAPIEAVYAGPALAIPDQDATGVSLQLALPAAQIATLAVGFDGAACSSDPFATGNGLDHTFLGDLEIRLVAPDSSEWALLDRPLAGFGDNPGNHLCQTRLEANAALSIQEAAANLSPFSGSFRAADDLAELAGGAAGGSWTLIVRDRAAGDFGSINAWRLILTPALCDAIVPELLHSDGFE